MNILYILLLIIYDGFYAKGLSNDCILRKYEYDSYVCVCNSTYCDNILPVKRLKTGTFTLITSSLDGDRFHNAEGSFYKDCPLNKNDYIIEVQRHEKFQKIEGFGVGFTDASGINLLSLPEGAQDNLLRSYFSEDGIEFNLGRVPIGGTDFSTHFYTYNDWLLDEELIHFSLTEEDYKYKIPTIKEALRLANHKIQLIGSAWTAPQWMKVDNDEQGGHLDKKYYKTWADYHLKFLDSYKEEGIKFWSLTTGNEPINGLYPFRLNSMAWNPINQRRWIIKHLGPSLSKSIHRHTKLLLMDDRREALFVWSNVIAQNKTARSYLSGFALHVYSDSYTSPTILDLIHKLYPDLFLLYTEASTGVRQTPRITLGNWQRAEDYVNNIIENLSHWVTGWVEWNLALDLEGGPNYVENYVDPMIIVNASAKEFYKQPTFYAVGHFSKFIPQGSVRIGTEFNSKSCLKYDTNAVSCQLEIQHIAFKRPDGAIVIVFLNRKEMDIPIVVSDTKRGRASINLKKKSFNTLLYW